MGTVYTINNEKMKLLQSFNRFLIDITALEKKQGISFKDEKRKMAEIFHDQIINKIGFSGGVRQTSCDNQNQNDGSVPNHPKSASES